MPRTLATQRLAGKTLHYDVEVKGIKTKSVPELNDEWVKELGQEGMNTLDDLRTRIREGMEHEKKHQAEHRVKEELLQQLTDEIPDRRADDAGGERDRPAAGARLALADRRRDCGPKTSSAWT